MNKKTYYKLLEEYVWHVNKKEFNEFYAETDAFKAVQKKLLDYLELWCRRTETMAMYLTTKSEYQEAYINEYYYCKLCILKEKISNGEQISAEEYNDTYLVEKYFGYWTELQMILITVLAFLLYFSWLKF